MNEEVANYINTEKELSRYNILMLQRGDKTPAKKRLIEMENEFLSIPFNEINPQTVGEATEAVELYRQSRRLFYLKYNVKSTDQLIVKISKKISFLDRLCSQLTSKRLEEINVLQDNDIYNEITEYYAKKKSIDLDTSIDILKHKSFKDLIDIEPAVIAKKRARLQTVLFSLGSYIKDFVDYDLDLEREVNSDFNLVNFKIDNFIFNIEKYAYRLYNDSLDIIPKKIANTMGRNEYIKRIYSLDNVFSMYKHAHAHTHVYTMGKKRKIDLSSPKLGNVYLGYKNIIYNTYQRDLDREAKNKVFGIIFPIERISREKMTSLHVDIYSSGINITELFCDSISNIRVLNSDGKKVYYKGIFMKPMWMLLNYASESPEYHYIVSKLIDEELNDISKFNDKKYITYINNKETPFIDIDLTSQILIPKTRSEEQYIEDIKQMLDKRISDIKNDYKNII